MKQVFVFLLFINLTVILQAQNKTVKDYIHKSKKEERKGNIRQATHYLNEAASMEWEAKNYKSAIKYFKKSIKLNKKIDNQNGIAMIHNNIGMIYSDMEDFQSATSHFEETLAYRRKINDKRGLIPSLTNLSITFNNLQNYNKSASYLEEALVIAKETSDAQQMRTCYGMLAEVYEKAGNATKSIHYFNLYRSFNNLVQKEKEDVLRSKAENAELEAKLLESEKRNKELEVIAKEKELLDKEKKLRESANKNKKLLKNLSKKELMNNLLKRNAEVKEKDAKIKESRLKKLKAQREADILRERITNFSFIGGLLLLGIILTVFYFRYKEKQKRNLLLKKQNLAISEQNEEITQQRDAIEEQSKQIHAERQKAENLLLNILPKAIAQELKMKGEAKMKEYERASILFTDFKGFTKIAHNISADELMEELNHCFSNFDRIINKHNMEKIKTIGDAYMCVGGIPNANLTNPIDAVLAGLEIQEFIAQERQKRFEEDGSEYWECRLGINTGEVRAGVIGKSKFAYDVWGDAVNMASRMESGGEAGKVNISEETYLLIKDFFDFTPRGEIEVKNGLILNMYFVNRIKKEFSADEKGLMPNEKFESLKLEKFGNTIEV